MGKGEGNGEGWGEGEGSGYGMKKGWKSGLCSSCKVGPKCKFEISDMKASLEIIITLENFLSNPCILL